MTVELKRIVCLANSYKPGGRCVAGKELLLDGRLGEWVRPVLSAEEGGVGDERMYENDTDPEPKVLDIMDVPIVRHEPQDHQQENWLIDPNSRWVKIRRLEPRNLEPFIEPATPLWIDGSSGSNGENDRVPFSEARSLKSSLRLIWIDALELCVFLNNRGERSVRGRFRYARSSYSLAVTDPIYRDRFLQLPDGNYSIGGRLATVSLGVPMNYAGYTYCYKLIAAIIRP